MKSISLKMSKNFKIELLCRNNIYELENNSCKLSIECEVDPDLTYKMHISHAGNKSFVVMDKGEDSISKLLSTPEINSNGVYYIQVEGIKEDYRIISNQIRLEVGSFINAEHIPTPEEQGIIDEIVIRLNGLDESVLENHNEIVNLASALTNEQSVRASADSALEASIDEVAQAVENEREARITSDNNLVTAINGKQDTLVAGENITINGNVISATGGGSSTYTAGDHITIENNVISADVPEKLSELINDVGFVNADYVQQELDKKMEFYKIVYDGTTLKHDGVVLTYSDIVAKYNDNKYFVYIEDGSNTFIPALPPIEEDPIIEFTSVSKYGGVAYIFRIIINSSNEIKYEYNELAFKTDIPTKTSQLANDKGFITGAVVRTVNNTAPDANGNVNVSGGGDVTKAYVDQQDAALQTQIDDEKAEIQQLSDDFNNFSHKTTIRLKIDDYTIIPNTYIKADGTLGSINSAYKVYQYDVSELDKVFVSTGISYGNLFYSVFDSSNNVVLVSQKSASGGTITYIQDQEVIIPQNGKTLNVVYFVDNTIETQTKYDKAIVVLDAKKWSDIKWCCVGDSLTELNSRTTKHYFDYVSDKTGINIINCGISGTGYANGQSTNKAFYQRGNTIPLDSDVVTIFGSFNDLTSGLELGQPTDSSTTTICGCINKTLSNFQYLMPLINLGIVSPTPWVGANPFTGSQDGTNYVNALKRICELRSIPFLDLYHCSNLRPWTEEGRQACYTKDDGNGVHPDENGHKLIAPRFEGFLSTLLL